MGRKITLGNTIIDQFAIFESDGFSKKSGETAFTATVWRDGAVSAVAVNISEIGTSGEYKVEFTPDALGFWVLEVLVSYNNDIYSGEYTVFAFGVGSPFDPEGVLP